MPRTRNAVMAGRFLVPLRRAIFMRDGKLVVESPMRTSQGESVRGELDYDAYEQERRFGRSLTQAALAPGRSAGNDDSRSSKPMTAQLVL